MQGKTHLLAGLLIGLFLASLVPATVTKIAIIAFAIVGSLFPDVDIATSTLGRKVKLVGYLFTHRGFFHSFLLLVLLSIIFAELFFFLAGASFFLGMFSHLLLDSITKEGLSFWPLQKRIKGSLKVGGFFEKILQLVLLALFLVLLLAFI